MTRRPRRSAVYVESGHYAPQPVLDRRHALSGILAVSSVRMGDGRASIGLVPDHGKAWHVWSTKHARPLSFRGAT
jgi:hypothetical protein